MLLNTSRRSSSWAVGLLGCLFILACGVLAADDEAADVAASASWQAAVHIPGFKPLYGVQEQPVTLDARQSTCSSNGSNFCFGDNVNFCASCGICCGSSSSGYCCGSDQICCGNACCASGQTCNNGECFLPLETVVITSATLVTVSHVATQLVTVEQAVVSTSTIFSTTVITVSNGGTQTDIVYVTVTAALAKRAIDVDALEARQEPRQDGFWATLSLFSKRFSFPWTPAVDPRSAPIQKRDARVTQAPLAPISSSTVITTSITRTSDVTSFVSSTTTVPTSSIVLVTVFQTRTSVLNAQTTITTTSTLTVTPNAPTTETVTRTATNTPSDTNTAPGASDTGTGTTTPPPDSGSKSSGLSTSAIAGIAGGIGGAAVLVLVLALLWWFRRRRNRPPPHQDPSSYLEPYIPDMSSPIPPPARTGTSPSNRFGASAPHHDADVAGVAGVAGVKNLDRYANISGGPGKKPLSPRLPNMAEAPGGEVYEADGTSRVPSHPQGEIYEADSGSPPLRQQRNSLPYPVDAGEMEGSPTSPTAAAQGHSRNVSGASSGGRYGSRSEELDGTGFSPVSEVDGTERLRNTNPYRSPGAYRDF